MAVKKKQATKKQTTKKKTMTKQPKKNPIGSVKNQYKKWEFLKKNIINLKEFTEDFYKGGTFGEKEIPENFKQLIIPLQTQLSTYDKVLNKMNEIETDHTILRNTNIGSAREDAMLEKLKGNMLFSKELLNNSWNNFKELYKGTDLEKEWKEKSLQGQGDIVVALKSQIETINQVLRQIEKAENFKN